MNSVHFQQLEIYQRRSLAPVRYIACTFMKVSCNVNQKEQQ